jgi:hypothetical protein
MIKLTLRHLRRNWGLNAAVLLCLTLASALMASLSGYAALVAARELTQSLDEARPVERNLFISGTRYTFNEELYGFLQEMLDELLRDRMVIRHATSPANPGQLTKGAGRSQAVALLDVYSFDKLPDYVRVVEGTLPDRLHLSEAEEQWRPPPMEVVIGARAAAQSGFGVGDRLEGSKGYHRLDVVGIVEPLDPNDDVWGEDLSGFAIGDSGTDGVVLPLIIAPGSMKSNYPQTPIFWHEVSWRITLHHHLISPGRAEELRSDLINFKAQFATEAAETDTDLGRILADYSARLSRVRMTLFLLTAQTLIFVLYALTLFTSSVVDRSRAELATLSARGASSWQVMRVLAFKNLILALLAALLLGPGLAQGAMVLWSWSHGDTVIP